MVVSNQIHIDNDEGDSQSLPRRLDLARVVHRRHLVVRHTLLKEVGLALERNHLHEVEGIRAVVVLRAAKRDEEAVRDELDVLTHELRVHADQGHGECVCAKSDDVRRIGAIMVNEGAYL